MIWNRVKEHLGTLIQTGGGSVGHSSVEDSIATLDLVRWYVVNKLELKKVLPQAEEQGQ
jgi:RNA exonuclease 1